MHIRLANPSDASAIADLHAASWRNSYRDALSQAYLAGDVVAERQRLWESRLAQPSANQHVLLAQSGAALVGFACVYSADHKDWGSYLNNIHVAQAMHGKGIGKVMLNAAASLCLQSNGESSMYLWVLQSNAKAQRFYSRFGAASVGVDMWEAPDGSSSPLYRFSWPSLVALHAATTSPARGASSGKLRLPPAASHVKRHALFNRHMPFEFWATRLSVFNEDETLVVALSEEPHDERDARYLMVQRSAVDDQQDRALGMSGPYIEVCDQAWGWYGHHISSIRLSRSAIHVQMDAEASSQMRNDGLISVTFDLDNTSFERLRSGLVTALRGFACFDDEA